uniref:Uncharacterized protein n=1 Tax=Arundo donax TaxID=35708 RepID=A0A0A9CCK8_ARUDO
MTDIQVLSFVIPNQNSPECFQFITSIRKLLKMFVSTTILCSFADKRMQINHVYKCKEGNTS